MYLDYDVVDQQDSKIGTLECLWSDQTGEPAFLGVRTGWIFGKTHVVPAQGVQVSERRRLIHIPFTKDKVKDAPFYDAESEMDEAREWEVHRYYGLGEARPAAAGQAPPPVRQAKERKRESSSRTAERSASIPLSEEKLKVGKRVVESGGVRLRKVIRTEVVNQPVELKREEAVIERVPSDKVARAGEHAFEGEEIYIPLRREEPVIEKETRVREEVRVRKESHTDRQDVSEHLRREDVEVEEGGEARKAGRERTSAEEMRERQELPRSQRRGK